jgi:hypothetical protein
MLLRVATGVIAFVSLCAADSLTLRSGRVIDGQYLGGDARQVRMAVGDRVETFEVNDITSLQFGGGQRVSEARDRDRNQDRDRGGFASQQPPPADRGGFASQQPPPQAYGVQIPVGTAVTVRMIDAVDSERARLGETFRASVDEPVMVGDQTVIARGADAVAKLVEDKQSGKFEGKTVLTLALQQVTINGRMMDITTGDVSQASSSRGGRTAKVVGGTTAVGAIIGAIAGGGKGAAIGAASGAAVGGAAQVMTKGQQVKIPSETRLTFTIQQPVQL